MFQGFSQRLLSLLQLTRMALVFTAISNILTGYLLDRQRDLPEGVSLLSSLHPTEMILIALISIGLYGFGMSLNDIIDRRRDSATAAHRPLPSGRIRVATAHTICVLLALLAVGCGLIYARIAPDGWRSLGMIMWVGALITFYDFAAKYLVWPGLLTLGLIRMFHALIPGPRLPCLWHPLILFTHVTLISAIAYAWEQKRPTLTRAHWFAVGAGILFVDVMAISFIWERSGQAGLRLTPLLLVVLALMVLFAALAAYIRTHAPTPREAGQRFMLAGLLWLILYDAAMALAYVGWVYAVALLVLLPVSYLMVLLMRWWSKILWIAQPPDYKRVRSGPARPD